MLTAKLIKKNINKITALGLAALLLLDMGSAKAFAADQPKATVEIEVQSDISGDTPADAETFVYEIVSSDNNAPMPQDATLNITGSGKASFGKIEYDNVGEYQYTIKQNPGTNANYTYDSSQYNITVAITRSDDGTLTPIMTVASGKERAKRSAVTFVNEYKAPSTETENPSEPSTEPESKPEPKPEPEPEKPSEPTTTPTNETTTTTTTTTTNETTTNNVTTYIPVVPKLVVDTTSPDYVNINTDPVPLATLETLIDEETPLAVMVTPKTGDSFNMILWIALLVGSAALIVAVISRKFLRERKK
jgi:pilin isopeptide linkage protein